MSASHWKVNDSGISGGCGAIVSKTVMVCDTSLVLPHKSVKVHVLLCSEPHWLTELVAVGTPITISPQLSVAKRSSIGGMSASHWKVNDSGISGT